MRRIFLAILLGIAFAVPVSASAAIKPLEGPIVPCSGVAEEVDGVPYPACQVCHAVELGQRFINFAVAAAGLIAVAIFSWAGFLMITAAGDTGAISRARGMFTNVALGLVITLAAWLIIDTIMKWAFQPHAGTEGSPLYKATESFGPWNEIECVEQPATKVTGQPPGSSASSPRASLSPGVRVPGKLGTVQCPDFNPNCNVEMLKNLGLTPNQANTMSCIAMTENAGMAVGCSGTGPCGTFQISRTDWGTYAPPECGASTFGNITAAQNNGPCNARTMAVMLRQRGYQPWTGCCNASGQPWNTNARTCVANYDPETNLRVSL